MISTAKLTLSVDARVVDRAKRHARAQGTSVSRLVESFLRVATEPDRVDSVRPPVLVRLRGSVKRGSVEDHRRALARKYR